MEEKKNLRYDMNINKQLTKIENKYFKNNDNNEAARCGSSLGLQNMSNQYFNQNAHKHQGLDYKSAQYNSLNILNKNSQTSLIQLPALTQQSTHHVSQMQNDQKDSQSLQTKIDEILIQNPNYLLHQHNICKQDNKERLKDINNLKDLVNFKVRTVADQLVEKNQRQLQQINSIPIDDDFYKNRLEAIKLSQIQTQSSINTIKKICDPVLANRGYPQLLSKKGLNPIKKNKQFNSNQYIFTSKNMDIQSQSQIIEDSEFKYDIPENLKQNPKNYNLIFANSQFTDFLKKQSTNESQNENQEYGNENKLLVKNDSFEIIKQQYENKQKELLDESVKLKEYHQIQFQDQQKKLEESIKKIQIDPVKLLKSYFQNKKKDKAVLQTKDFQKSKIENDLFQNSIMQQSELASSNGFQNDPIESKIINKRDKQDEPLIVGAVHENYVISKYQKKLRTGKLEKEIEQKNNELQFLENIQSQIKQDNINLIYNVIKETNKTENKNQANIKDLTNQIKQLGPQKIQILTQLLQAFVHQDKQNKNTEKNKDNIQNKEDSIQSDRHNISKLGPIEMPKVNYEQFINESKLQLQQNITSQDQSQQNINTSSIEEQNSQNFNISSVKKMRKELINIFDDSVNMKSAKEKQKYNFKNQEQNDIINSIDKIIHSSNIQDSSQINNENFGIELSQILNLNEENQNSPIKQISQNKLAVENLLKQIKGELSFSEIRKQKIYIEDIVEDRSTKQFLSKTHNDSRGIFNNDSYNDYQTQAGSINMQKSKIIGKSGLVHSELLKYQFAKNYNKNTQNVKKLDKIIKNSNKEIHSVQNKKLYQNEQSQFTNSIPNGSNPIQNMSQELSQLINNEQSFDLTAKNSLFINQSQDVVQRKNEKLFEQYALNNGMKLNLHGSIPQIKQQLDKKQFSIMLMNDQSNLKNENFQFVINDQNIQPQNQEIILDQNIYQQKFHDKQTSFNNQQSQDSSILNVNLHYDIPNSSAKENKVLYIGKSQTDQHNNSIRSQYGTMKGSQNEKDLDYDNLMRVSGVKLPKTAQNQINQLRGKNEQKQFQQAVKKINKHVSPLRTLNELEYSTPKLQEFNIVKIENEKIEEDENYYQNQIDNQNLYNQYFDQNIEIKNTKIIKNQDISDQNSPGYQYGDNSQIMNKSNEQFDKNQLKKPFSLTKSSRVSIFSNQQNKTFSNNFKKSEDLMDKQNSGKIQSSKSSQARSENFIRNQNLKESLNTQKQINLQSQTQFNQTYQNFKDIEQFKQRKNQTNLWKKNDEDTEKSQNSIQSGMIKGKMNLSAMMTDNRLQTKNYEMADSAEKIKSENGTANQQNSKFQDTLINETGNKENSTIKQLKQREQFIQNTLIQIENTRNRQLDQNIDIQQQNQAQTQTKIEKNLQVKPKKYECQFDENSISQKQKTLNLQNEQTKKEKGYHSSNEPYMDQASSELYDQILRDHFVRKGCWIPSRFKMFPRFAIFTNKNKQALDDNSSNQHEQYISLSSNVLALLAGINITDQQCMNTFLQQPAITNQSKNVMHAYHNSQNTSIILTPNSKLMKLNERIDTDGTAHLEQSYREKIDMQIQKGSGLNYNENQSKVDEQASATYESGLRNEDQVGLIRIQKSTDQHQNDHLENKVGTVRLQNYNQLQVPKDIKQGEGQGQSTTILNDYSRIDQPQSTYKNNKFKNSNDDLSSARNMIPTDQHSVMDVLINNEINHQSSLNLNNKFTINQTINYSSIDLEKNQSINNQNKIFVQNNTGQSNVEQQKVNQIKKGEEIIKTKINSDQLSNPDLSNLQLLQEESNQSLIVKHFDPFNKVLLTKGMDNQILTSYRTIIKTNNMLSNTLKVVHQRFLAKSLNKSVINRLPRGKFLYPISMEILQKFAQEMLIQDELENMNDDQRKDLIDNLEQLNLISQYCDIDNINLDSYFIQNQAKSNLNNQQLNIIKIDNIPQIQNSSEFNDNQISQDKSFIQNQHQKNIILSGQTSIMKNVVQQRNFKISDEKNSSSNPQDESKMEINSKNGINNNYQENSIIEVQTREFEDEKTQTYSKIKTDKNNSTLQKSDIQNENQKSSLANKTLISINTQSNQNNKNRLGSIDINDQDFGSDKFIDLQKNKNTIINSSSLNPQVNYLYDKQNEQQKAQKKQIIKKIEGKIVKKRENLHIPMYDISTGTVVRQEQNELKNSQNYYKDSKTSSNNQLNLLSLTQQIAQAILTQKNQLNSPVDKFQIESWKMNLFNMDPQYSQTNQKQIQLNNSIYSSQIDEEYSKNEQKQATKLLNKYNTDLMNSKKQKDEILQRLEENLSYQNNHYGNAPFINQKQPIKFSSINMSSHHINQSDQIYQSKKEDADSMKNIHKDYKKINIYNETQNKQSLLQGALNINFRIPIEQQESSSIYMVTPGRSLYTNQINKQNSLKNNTTIRSQNQKRVQQQTKTEQIRLSIQELPQKQKDDIIQANVINQHLEQVKSFGESGNSNIRNSLSLIQGNTEILSKTRANLDVDSKTYYDYGKDQLKMNIEESLQQYQQNGTRQEESPYVSEDKPQSYSKPKALQNINYVDFDNTNSKINLIVLDKNVQNNNDNLQIPFTAIKIDNEFQLNDQIKNTNEDYEEQKIIKINIDQSSDEKNQFKFFDKSFYKLNESKSNKKTNNNSSGSQDYKSPNQMLKNNQDLQHAVSFLNENQKKSDRSNPQKEQANPIITLQKIRNSNEISDQNEQDIQMFTQRDNIITLAGGQANSININSQFDKSKDSNFDHSYEKNLQSKFAQQENENLLKSNLQNESQDQMKIKENQEDKKVKRKSQIHNDNIYKYEKGQKNQQQKQKKFNQNFGGGFNSFANQNKIEEQLIQLAKTSKQIKNQQLQKEEQKTKNQQVEILMSVIQQTNSQNLQQIQKVLLNIVENIKNQESVETELKHEDRLLIPETLQINSTLFSQSPRLGETISFKQLNLDQTIEQPSTKKDNEVITSNQLQKLTQMIVGQNSQSDGKQQIKKVIDELYTSQKRYQKKISNRTDLINTCDFIFDLNKAKGIIQDQSNLKQQDIQLKIDYVKINNQYKK